MQTVQLRRLFRRHRHRLRFGSGRKRLIFPRALETQTGNGRHFSFAMSGRDWFPPTRPHAVHLHPPGRVSLHGPAERLPRLVRHGQDQLHLAGRHDAAHGHHLADRPSHGQPIQRRLSGHSRVRSDEPQVDENSSRRCHRFLHRIQRAEIFWTHGKGNNESFYTWSCVAPLTLYSLCICSSCGSGKQHVGYTVTATVGLMSHNTYTVHVLWQLL